VSQFAHRRIGTFRFVWSRMGSYDIAVLSEFGVLNIYWPKFSQLLMFGKDLVSSCFHLYK
jgi:hypothetical protein